MGASIVSRIDELTEQDGGVRANIGFTNFLSCRYAKADQILDACRETVYEISRKSFSDARMLIFVGLGDIRSEAFSGAWMAAKVSKFAEDISEFNKMFRRNHQFSLVQLIYPTGLSKEKYAEIDKVNRVYESVNASLGRDTFAPGRKFYRDCAVDLKPNVYVGGEPKFSPVEFWRNRNDIHPADEQMRQIDRDLRSFLKDNLNNPEELKTYTGVTFKKKKRNFARMSEDSTGNEQAEGEQQGTPAIPGANWVATKRNKPWTNRQREAEFEKKIEGLDEEEKQKKRKERKDRQQQIEEDKKKKGQEAKEEAQQLLNKRKQELHRQLEQAKKDNDMDRQTALTASIMRLGTDI